MLGKKKKKTIRIKVCPICGSRNIKLSSAFDGWLTPETYICLQCGYSGPIVLELQIDPKELKEKEDDKEN